MKRTKIYQFGIAAGICLMGLCGIGRGAINSHLTWISIRQGQSYSSAGATSPGYFFVLKLNTDNTVSSVEFTTPRGLACTIPSTATHASSGDVQTSYKVWRGTARGWEYQAWFNTIEGLADYGDGTYTIRLNYISGSPETTTVAYVIPGSSTPIPQPTQKPNITSPAFGASVVPPVAFTWSACSDANVPDAATSADEIALEIYDSDDIDKLPKLLNQTATSTSADPCGLDDGRRSAQVMFQRRYTFNNANRIPCEVLKGSATMHEFEVTYSKVHRFRLAGSTTCHLWTAMTDEVNILKAEYPSVWQYEAGSYFYVFLGRHSPDLVPVYRLWNTQNNDHFLTAGQAERDYLLANYGWLFTDEGVGFYAYTEATHPTGTVPVYRLYHSAENIHYYTDDVAEKNQMLTAPTSWSSEGIAFYAYP